MIKFIFWYLVFAVLLYGLLTLPFVMRSEYDRPLKSFNVNSIILFILLPIIVVGTLLWEITFVFYLGEKFFFSTLCGITGVLKSGTKAFIPCFYEGLKTMPVFLGPFSKIPNIEKLDN